MEQLFSSLHDHLSKEQSMREVIRENTKEIDHYARQIVSILQTIHSDDNAQTVVDICQKSRELLKCVKESYDKLKEHVPKNEYYHYNDSWRHVTQQLSSLVALIVFLESNRLVSRDEFADTIGVRARREEGFHVDLEDYLVGLLQLATELSRLAVNSVTHGNYYRPIQISKFVSELHSGFRVLNLKNDYLRKRFDGLKYDVRKVEEVVYDLSIRGLLPSDEEYAKCSYVQQSTSVTEMQCNA